MSTTHDWRTGIERYADTGNLAAALPRPYDPDREADYLVGLLAAAADLHGRAPASDTIDQRQVRADGYRAAAALVESHERHDPAAANLLLPTTLVDAYAVTGALVAAVRAALAYGQIEPATVCADLRAWADRIEQGEQR